MNNSLLAELLFLHVKVKPCSDAKPLSRFDYATAEAAGFDMKHFTVEPTRYARS